VPADHRPALRLKKPRRGLRDADPYGKYQLENRIERLLLIVARCQHLSRCQTAGPVGKSGNCLDTIIDRVPTLASHVCCRHFSETELDLLQNQQARSSIDCCLNPALQQRLNLKPQFETQTDGLTLAFVEMRLSHCRKTLNA
jgi:hypothetical protein